MFEVVALPRRCFSALSLYRDFLNDARGPGSFPLGTAFKRFDVGGTSVEGREAGVPKSAAILYGGGDGDAEIESGWEGAGGRAGECERARPMEKFAQLGLDFCAGETNDGLSCRRRPRRERATCLFSRLGPKRPRGDAKREPERGRGKGAAPLKRLA